MEALALKSFLTMFVVIDPVGLIPIYLGLDPHQTPTENRATARRAISIGAVVLVVFTLAGAQLLEHLGISLDAFRIAGGLLLLKIAVDMVFAQRERETPEEAQENRQRTDISVFPLAVPLVAGPGAMASVMILAGESDGGLGIGVVLGCTAAVLVLAYTALRMSSRLSGVLGQTGINVVTRLLGVMLAALSVQYVADGVMGFIAPV